MRYKEAKIENCDIELQNAIDLAIKENKGLFIYGNSGVGKTYFCHALANAKNDIHVSNFIDLLSEFRDWIKKGFYSEKIDELCKENYLVIDDMGAEKITEFVFEFVYTIINKRYENMKRTVITTNLSLDDFQERYGDRILSRIAEMCVMIELKGKNKRIE